MSAIGIVKFIGAWFCIIGAVVLLVLGHQLFGIPGVLALLAIAFSQLHAVYERMTMEGII